MAIRFDDEMKRLLGTVRRLLGQHASEQETKEELGPRIQGLLAAGLTTTGRPSEEFLGGLIEKAVTAARREPPPPQPAFGIGEGEPGWRRPFANTWDKVRMAGYEISEPSSLVYREGPGFVQHFD